jgi:ubiquinone/menaquinone biosynthesis C-methylase UbiE
MGEKDMAKPRVPETDHGIVGEFEVAAYDEMQRRFRNKGWIQTSQILKNGITRGSALEIGPGPGYLGLEWLKSTQGTTLTGLDISSDMIAIARRNAEKYGLADRVEYVESGASTMPFSDAAFDAVFTNGSLHEWADPKSTFGEIWRVLKPKGKIFVSDVRRDISPSIRRLLSIRTKSAEMRACFDSSLAAAYTPGELADLVNDTPLENCSVSGTPFGLALVGTKHEE